MPKPSFGIKDPITEMAIERMVEMGVPRELIMKHCHKMVVIAERGDVVTVELKLWLASPRAEQSESSETPTP